MTPITELLEAKDLNEVRRIEKKYLEYLPDNQKWKFQNWVEKTKKRISHAQ
jgi:hypothetical protein